MKDLITRLKNARRAFLIHLGISLLVGLVCASLVFLLWYPFPYHELVGGRTLFLLLMSVDVACGPLLTLTIFSNQKSRSALVRDFIAIGLIQLLALSYGIFSVASARPVLLAFEGNRFRVVTAPDIDRSNIRAAPEALRVLSLSGPKLIGTTISRSSDLDFLSSVQLSIAGLHPSYRPGRWRPYEEFREEVKEVATPIGALLQHRPEKAKEIGTMSAKKHLPLEDLGYLPLVAGKIDDWVVVIDLTQGSPVDFMHIDGWLD